MSDGGVRDWDPYGGASPPPLMITDPDRWQAVRRLLGDARQLAPAARAAWLGRAVDDPELRAEVAALLAADDDTGGFLVTPAADRAADLFADTDDAYLGRRVGPWRIEERIGEGGMGVVFRAARADADFEQEAALKLVGRGLAPRALLDRFRRERRILARLEHPGIARLLDGGLSEDGQPYFAMELVRGVPLTAYADERDLDVRQRVRLLRDVAEAVAVAHQNLVVHRDLKPSNVLVVEDADGRPSVKLLDFGIAKLLSEDEEDGTLTATAALMTPAYAAPEQVTGAAVTTATDVYALGVLLYELLAGRRPHDLGPGAAPTAVVRAVCETEPPAPSAVAPPARARALRGDLDTIVGTALAKEPSRRYVSASALAEDLGRHLDRVPVAARRPTVGYRVRSFVRRHPVGVGLAALAVVSLVLGLAGTAWQAHAAAVERDHARTEAERAEQTADFLRDLFAASDPLNPETEGDTLRARTLLLRGAARLPSELADQPEVRASLQREIAVSLRNLGLYAASDSLLREAIALQRETGDRAELAASLYERSLTLDRLGDYDGTTQTAAEALALRRAALAPDDPDLGRAMDWMATVHEWNGLPDSALALEREAIALLERAVPPGDDRLLQARHNLGWMLVHQGKPSEAVPVLERTVADARASNPDHPEIPATLTEWAIALRQLDRLDEAEALYDEALAAQRARFGPDHATVGVTLSNRARVSLERGDLDAAESAYRQALSIFRARFGPEAYNNGVVLTHLASIARRRGRLADAERLVRQALAIHNAAFPDGSEFTASTQIELGRVLQARGRTEAATPHVRAALSIREAQYGPDHSTTTEARDLLAALVDG